MKNKYTLFLTLTIVCLATVSFGQLTYPIVGTNQSTAYNNSEEISLPGSVADFYGQNANYSGNTPEYVDNEDGTVTDMVTGLMWSQTTDLDGDGDIDADDKLSLEDALNGASAFNLGGYDDWRLPTIKEAYSLIIFSGEDPSGYEGTSTDGLVPFIDNDYFTFGYGDTDSGERIIDAQYASSTEYVDYTMNGDETMFGVNFADGRIKGYPISMMGTDKTFYVAYVRGNTSYGTNSFTDNGDETITDNATGLMWMQDDSGEEGLNWEEALAYAENFEFANYSEWRLPDVKELQSILDYTRSPETTNSAAIDALFNCTEISNENDEIDYSYYWSSTTHATMSSSANNGSSGAYVSFGRAMGKMNDNWLDVHGAGAQRSDPKEGDPADYPDGFGPQGDARRIYNYVRLVRNTDEANGLNDTKIDQKLNVYPNPIKDIINLEFTDEGTKDIMVLDVTGKTLFKLTTAQKAESITLQDFETGIYFITVHSTNGKCTQKIILE